MNYIPTINIVISVSVSREKGGAGRDLVYKKQGVCADWWWKLNTCINRVGIFCQLLVSCVSSRGWTLRLWCPGVAGCHNGLLLWPCGHSELNELAAAVVLLWREVPFLRVGESGGRLASMVNMRVEN